MLFDEADALFKRRGEVRDGHDRYANMKINYLFHRVLLVCRMFNRRRWGAAPVPPRASFRDGSPLCRQLPTGTVTFLFTDVEGSTRQRIMGTRAVK
jgi:hypothetical protein